MGRKIFISYDADADVMYLGFGKRAKAVGEEIEDGVFARYDPKTEELIGITLVNFSKKFRREPKGIAIPSYGGAV